MLRKISTFWWTSAFFSKVHSLYRYLERVRRKTEKLNFFGLRRNFYFTKNLPPAMMMSLFSCFCDYLGSLQVMPGHKPFCEANRQACKNSFEYGWKLSKNRFGKFHNISEFLQDSQLTATLNCISRKFCLTSTWRYCNFTIKFPLSQSHSGLMQLKHWVTDDLAKINISVICWIKQDWNWDITNLRVILEGWLPALTRITTKHRRTSPGPLAHVSIITSLQWYPDYYN